MKSLASHKGKGLTTELTEAQRRVVRIRRRGIPRHRIRTTLPWEGKRGSGGERFGQRAIRSPSHPDSYLHRTMSRESIPSAPAPRDDSRDLPVLRSLGEAGSRFFLLRVSVSLVPTSEGESGRVVHPSPLGEGKSRMKVGQQMSRSLAKSSVCGPVSGLMGW